MRAVRILGWAIVVFVIAHLAMDLYAVYVDGFKRPVVTWEHIVMFLIAILGIGMASDEITARIVKMALAFRGRKED